MVPRPARDCSTPGQRVWYRFWTTLRNSSSVSQWNRVNTDRLVGRKGQVNSHCNHWACTFPCHFLIFYVDITAAPRMSQENRRNMTAYEDFFCTSNRKLLTTCSPGNETSFNTIIPACSVPFNTCYTSCNWWVIGTHRVECHHHYHYRHRHCYSRRLGDCYLHRLLFTHQAVS